MNELIKDHKKIKKHYIILGQNAPPTSFDPALLTSLLQAKQSWHCQCHWLLAFAGLNRYYCDGCDFEFGVIAISILRVKCGVICILYF